MQGEDGVVVRADTLRNIGSGVVAAQPVYMAPDSGLLGECRSQDYGTLKADILTQFACPEGWVYPDSSEVDSVCLYIYYRSYYGDGSAPMGLNAYWLDRERLSYDSTYESSVDVSRFTSLSRSVLNGTEVISPAHPTDSIYSSSLGQAMPFIRMRLNEQTAKQLFAIRDFSSQKKFNEQFPGLYITSTYGSSSALYIYSLCLTIHYHFTYESQGMTKTMQDSKVLYSNAEVKRVYHYDYADREQVLARLEQDTAHNYILSPANIYARLAIPTTAIVERILDGVQSRTPYINLARLRVDVMNGGSTGAQSDNWAQPASEMLLLKEGAYDDLFRRNILPTDTNALLSSLTKEYNTDSARYDYYYSFDLSTLFTALLRENRERSVTSAESDTMYMLLVPVDAEYTTSSSTTYLSGLKLKQSVSATCIRSSQNSASPMDVDVVYSGFYTKQIGK